MKLDTLIVPELERQRLGRLEAEGVMTIRPAALPEGRYLEGINRHLGWPVGAKAGGTLLCAYHRTKWHHGPGKVKDRRDDDSCDAIVVRSTDDGRTWSDPIDVRQFGVNDKPTVIRVQNSFGVLNGSAFLATRYGLYRSDDEGETWRLIPGALTREQTGFTCEERTCGQGPRMVVHPEKGLDIFKVIMHPPCLEVFNPTDEGNTSHNARIPMSDTIHPCEPTAIYHEGRLIFVTRNQPLPFKLHKQLSETQRPAMLVSHTGWFPMTHMKLTNISSYRWPDTTDVAFNPVSGRYEAVVTNRNGGTGDDEKSETEETLNLWSLSREDMDAGHAEDWRLEGTLLRTEPKLEITPEGVDTAHPGGAVIDQENGVQHIFIYCGRFATPTGVYRITRTLDTARLRRAM